MAHLRTLPSDLLKCAFLQTLQVFPKAVNESFYSP